MRFLIVILVELDEIIIYSFFYFSDKKKIIATFGHKIDIKKKFILMN